MRHQNIVSLTGIIAVQFYSLGCYAKTYSEKVAVVAFKYMFIAQIQHWPKFKRVKFILLILLFCGLFSNAQTDTISLLRKVAENNTKTIVSKFDTLVKFTVSDSHGGRIEHSRFLTLLFDEKRTLVQAEAHYINNQKVFVIYYFRKGKFILEQTEYLEKGETAYTWLLLGTVSYGVVDAIKGIEMQVQKP